MWIQLSLQIVTTPSWECFQPAGPGPPVAEAGPLSSCASSMLKPSNLSRVFITLQGKVHVTLIISDNVISLSACEHCQRWTSVAPVEVSPAEVTQNWTNIGKSREKQTNNSCVWYFLHQLYSKLVLWKLHLHQLLAKPLHLSTGAHDFPPETSKPEPLKTWAFFRCSFSLFIEMD